MAAGNRVHTDIEWHRYAYLNGSSGTGRLFREEDIMQQSPRFIPTNRLERYDLVNEKGQDLGQVQNFVIDMLAGRIAFVIVAFGGMLG